MFPCKSGFIRFASLCFVSEENKGPLLRYLIKQQDLKQVLVFTSSVYNADKVTDKLRKNGIDAAAIHSKKSQGARTDALTKFKAGKLRVLVATDLISRGIDMVSNGASASAGHSPGNPLPGIVLRKSAGL